MNAASSGRSRRLMSRRAAWLLATGAAIWSFSAHAHVLSMSQGSLRLDGQSVRYELRMPLSEVPQDPDRQRILLEALVVQSEGAEGLLAEGACREELGQDLYICEAAYRFADPPDTVSVRCEFPSVTVPHHVHILRSGEGDTARQTVFDITFREAEIRFAPPTRRRRRLARASGRPSRAPNSFCFSSGWRWQVGRGSSSPDAPGHFLAPNRQ